MGNFAGYIELTKPRITGLILVTTAVGFFMGNGGSFWDMGLFVTLLGTSLSSSGASTLNNYIERDIDALMSRTAKRALVVGRIEPNNALAFGLILVVAGVTLLAAKINLLTGFLSLLTVFLYVLVYTPLKRVTWLNTFIGAFPGAIPALGGWTAATGQIALEGWFLFALVFLWQFPHFYSIAWIFKDDYSAAGFKMLPSIDPSGSKTLTHSLFFSILLLIVSLIPYFRGICGEIYLCGALVSGAMLVAVCWLSFKRISISARSLLRASVIYLPVLLVLLVLDYKII
ncbi:MAG TPA: heme o synthase [Oligoflexia bacterium]|nr:heme o synthase [Oligoflexia bacterium]HMP26779.1 heme o synthase [Oligoflexia bacterium]